MNEPSSGTTRPLLYGYVRAHLMMTDAELADMKARLACFAEQEGYTIGAVFVERIDRAPAALHALLEAVQRNEAAAIVVPSMQHLAVLGTPDAVKKHLEHYAKARVLIAGSKPEQPGRSRDSP